jgi:hypothetical protein
MVLKFKLTNIEGRRIVIISKKVFGVTKTLSVHMKHVYFEARDLCYLNINHLHKENIEIFTMVLKLKLTKIEKEEAWLLYPEKYLE